MGGVIIEEDDSRGDISKKGSIHDDELSDTEDSDNSSSDQGDETTRSKSLNITEISKP